MKKAVTPVARDGRALPVTDSLDSGSARLLNVDVGFPDEREVRFDDRGEDRCSVQRPDIPHVPGPGLTHFLPLPQPSG
jgi:hypothetical protein